MEKKLIYEVVLDEMVRRVREGLWKPGERIPSIEELSAELNVGVSSVREAVRILGKQHVLVVEQGRGTFVNANLSADWDRQRLPEPASWLQLTEARLVVEPELAAMAAERATTAEAEAILQCARAMQRKVRAGQPFVKDDIEFHERIADAARNEVLQRMIRLASEALVESRRRTMRMTGMDDKAASYHLLIASAIAERQPDRARELMRLHLADMIEQWRREERRPAAESAVSPPETTKGRRDR